MSSLLTREQILSARDREPLALDVPEWGGRVLIATIDAKTRAAYEEATDGPYELLRATVLSMFLVDEAGHRLFTPDDVAALNAKSGAVVSRVFRAAIKHNKLRRGDIEDAEKNSGPASGEDSSSDSPATSTVPSLSCSTEQAPTS